LGVFRILLFYNYFPTSFQKLSTPQEDVVTRTSRKDTVLGDILPILKALQGREERIKVLMKNILKDSIFKYLTFRRAENHTK
jgi:hypothetical protein